MRETRIRLYLIILVSLVVGGTAAFLYFEKMPFTESLYLAFITLTTVGYGDLAPKTLLGRATSVILAASGLLVVFGIGASLVEENLLRAIQDGTGRKRKLIDAMRDHHIVCGYGRLGKRVVDQFRRLGQPIVVIERDPELAKVLSRDGVLVVEGDALAEETLRQAGIDRAKSLIATFSTDALNVYLALECHDLNRDLEVICRASGREEARRMYLAGADRVISPDSLAAEMIAKSAINPAVIQLMSDVTDATQLGEGLNQVPVAAKSRLDGLCLKDLRTLGLQVKVVAVKHGGKLDLPQGGDYVINAGSLLVVAGAPDELHRMEHYAREEKY